MTATTAAVPNPHSDPSDFDIARVACEGRSLMIDSRGIAADMLGGYSAPYVRAVMADPAAPRPLQLANNGAFLYVRLEVALFLLRRERIAASAKRERTRAATAARLGALAAQSGARRLPTLKMGERQHGGAT